MPEKTLWTYVKNGMKGKWSHATRHEDMVSVGVPDVSYFHCGNSWIELKNVDQLPKRPTTGVNMNFTEGQSHYLKKRHGWLLVRFLRPERKYLIYSHHTLPPWERPYWTADELYCNAYYVWHSRIDFVTLAELLEVT